jgi:hypothetical protein
MTREEKCKLAIDKGFTYTPDNGVVIGPKGNNIIAKNSCGYIRIWLWFEGKGHQLFAHQFAWYWINKEVVEQIDHINGNRVDNRIENLRAVNHQQNQWNRTKAKGYYFEKSRNKWKAHISIKGKNIHLGRFDTEEEARASYLQAKEKYHIIKNPD